MSIFTKQTSKQIERAPPPFAYVDEPPLNSKWRLKNHKEQQLALIALFGPTYEINKSDTFWLVVFAVVETQEQADGVRAALEKQFAHEQEMIQFVVLPLHQLCALPHTLDQMGDLLYQDQWFRTNGLPRLKEHERMLNSKFLRLKDGTKIEQADKVWLNAQDGPRIFGNKLTATNSSSSPSPSPSSSSSSSSSEANNEVPLEQVNSLVQQSIHDMQQHLEKQGYVSQDSNELEQWTLPKEAIEHIPAANRKIKRLLVSFLNTDREEKEDKKEEVKKQQQQGSEEKKENEQKEQKESNKETEKETEKEKEKDLIESIPGIIIHYGFDHPELLKRYLKDLIASNVCSFFSFESIPLLKRVDLFPKIVPVPNDDSIVSYLIACMRKSHDRATALLEQFNKQADQNENQDDEQDEEDEKQEEKENESEDPNALEPEECIEYEQENVPVKNSTDKKQNE